jgi:hypothetical protein
MFVVTGPWKAVSYIGAFVGGFFSNYLLEWLREGRATRQELAREIYRPILQQFVSAVDEVHSGDRPHAIAINFWRNLKANGRADRIPRELRDKLENVYEVLGPKYDALHVALNERELPRIMWAWEEKYGEQHKWRQGETSLHWQLFLTAETFSPPLLGSPHENWLRLWNRYVDLTKLLSAGVALNSFLHDRWLEAKEMVEIKDVKQARKNLLREIGSVRPRLTKLAR